MRMICAACGNKLSVDEMEYLGDSCGRCAREWNERMEAWRRGAHDPDLDALFREDEPVEAEPRPN